MFSTTCKSQLKLKNNNNNNTHNKQLIKIHHKIKETRIKTLENFC